ncbi:hypothetical protein B0H10DRAFT_2018578 [Mycena sp. CBHHK59/15]|nr:hypothetical protein B0H10DRAFT_2018578 [Mycena sp. CBHHK59/15]
MIGQHSVSYQHDHVTSCVPLFTTSTSSFSRAMSVWQIGMNEVTEETQAFKNKLSSKGGAFSVPLFNMMPQLPAESQIAAQQTEIIKQAAQLAELKATLNDTLHKLNHEAARAVTLESTLAKCTEDLRNETLAAQNAAAALVGAQEKLRAKDLETRELEATLESISHKSEGFNARGAKLEKEKSTLEARVRELEGTLRQLSSPAPTATPARQRVSRPRSSSVSDTRIITLEQDLKDTRASLTQRETELRAATGRLAQVQNDLVKVDNEKLALDRRLHAEIRDLQMALQEKNEDLEYGREEELLKRIDEDDAKIAALERLLRDAPETQSLKERLRRAEQKLLVESERKKEEALDEVEDVRAQMGKLSDELRKKEGVIEGLNAIHPTSSASVEADIERLLGAIERLRGERDDLRRDVHFLQSEAKFTEEASVGANENAQSAMPDPQLRADMDVLQQRLAEVTVHEQAMLRENNEEIRRLGLAAMASAVVIEHLRSQAGAATEQLFNAAHRLKSLDAALELADQNLVEMTKQRDEVLSQLALKEREWMQETEHLKLAHQDTQDNLQQLEVQLNDMSKSLEQAESERDSLTLQVTNLLNDLAAAQHELTEAETRYSSLQFHQLSSMSSNEATHALREQIEEMEMRVMRRTEQIGIHQHDIRRLETNLKLQEERLSEMTTEMELILAQKDAMVEDCADAREARDAAIARVEGLEVETETLEARLEDSEIALCTLVGVVVQTAGRSRDALRVLSDRANRAECVASELQSAPPDPVVAAELSAREVRISELDKKQQDLQLLISNMEASHQAEIQQLNEQLAEKDHLASSNDLESELARLKVKHVEEMGSLQGRLVEATSVLDEAHTRYEAAEANYLHATADSTRSKQELETVTRDAAAEAEGLRAEIARIQAEHDSLRDELRAVALQEREDAHNHVVDELVQSREASETHVRQLEDRIAQLHSELEEQVAQYESRTKDAEELQHQSNEKRKDHAAALEDVTRRYEHAESMLARQKQDLMVVVLDLRQAREEAEASEEERIALQEEITALRAEIQRSLSLHRYLDNQVKESERITASLASDLEHFKTQCAHAEKIGKAAEVNLSLQSAQYRREMAELEAQLATLRSRPDLQSIVAELEERNNEMEELLKNKCAEIEENDDRAIEMLKNNKKLTTKVESLTRKVQNLQTKLAAAKASNPTASTEVGEHKASPSIPVTPSTRPRSNTLSSIPPVPPLPSYVPSSPVRAPSNRVASGSSLPRPKTPERRALPQAHYARPSFAFATILGRKRPAPDDFADVNIPAQGFTPDSLPRDDENGTPRVRRALSSLHSGFTPVRQSARPSVPSPKRALPARSSPYIADVTNSPRMGDAAKGTSQPSRVVRDGEPYYDWVFAM